MAVPALQGLRVAGAQSCRGLSFLIAPPPSRQPHPPQPQRRNLSDEGSHSDFAPKRKAVSSEEDEVQQMIADHVRENRVMLYMKGNPSMPMCGFSGTVVNILKSHDVDFASVNVLEYPTIREGIKKFSDWPTVPQLYVDGEFVGGCDIVTAMEESGELQELLKPSK